jgi:hypothetical protein
MNLEGIGYDGVDLFHIDVDKVQWGGGGGVLF